MLQLAMDLMEVDSSYDSCSSYVVCFTFHFRLSFAAMNSHFINVIKPSKQMMFCPVKARFEFWGPENSNAILHRLALRMSGAFVNYLQF